MTINFTKFRTPEGTYEDAVMVTNENAVEVVRHFLNKGVVTIAGIAVVKDRDYVEIEGHHATIGSFRVATPILISVDGVPTFGEEVDFQPGGTTLKGYTSTPTYELDINHQAWKELFDEDFSEGLNLSTLESKVRRYMATYGVEVRTRPLNISSVTSVDSTNSDLIRHPHDS